MKKEVSQKQVLFELVFNRKKKLNQKGTAPIEIRVYQHRKRIFYATKILVLPEQWDEKKKMIKSNHPQAKTLNSQIQSMVNSFENLQAEALFKNRPFGIEECKLALAKDTQNPSFIVFMEQEITNDRTLAQKTKTSHFNTLNKIKSYMKGKDLLFTNVKFAFCDDFLNHYLREEGLANNTIHKQLKNLKKYIEIAIKKEFIETENPCKDIKVRFKQIDREVLTIEEIRSIENLDLSQGEEKIAWVRDIFLFACFTGLRISDVVSLKTRDVLITDKGYTLDFISVKTKKRAEIPLNILFKMPEQKQSKPEKLLENYYKKTNELVFPKISEPFINRNLKIIGNLANIKIKLVFHTARHSFGTYMSSKIPLPQLMFLMQHSDIRTTMIYVNIHKDLVRQGLLKVDWEY